MKKASKEQKRIFQGLIDLKILPHFPDQNWKRVAATLFNLETIEECFLDCVQKEGEKGESELILRLQGTSEDISSEVKKKMFLGRHYLSPQDIQQVLTFKANSIESYSIDLKTMVLAFSLTKRERPSEDELGSLEILGIKAEKSE